jgi:hypothetical protein
MQYFNMMLSSFPYYALRVISTFISVVLLYVFTQTGD